MHLVSSSLRRSDNDPMSRAPMSSAPLSSAMRTTPLLAAVILALVALAGCSKKDLPTEEFQVLQETPETRAEALAKAKVRCEEQTRRSGMKSVLSIFSRLRPGSAERAFIECMEDKGFDPNAPEEFPERPDDKSLMTELPAEH